MLLKELLADKNIFLQHLCLFFVIKKKSIVFIKTTKIYSMKKWVFIGIGILGMFSLTSFTKHQNDYLTVTQKNTDEVTAIIKKNTTEKELEDIKGFFLENDIELIINKIDFNKQKEIIGLSIVLKKGNSKTQYSSSSNTPISEIKLGYKDGGLYITNSGMSDIMVFKKQSGFNNPAMDMDSIMRGHGFAFNFNDHMDIQKLKDQIMKSFDFDEDENGNFTFNGQHATPFHNSRSQKFNFVDNPDINKLIIIDGKEADFDTLDKLAKSDKLAEVDFLKPTTAISIYGDKAKDGAIIATTKK